MAKASSAEAPKVVILKEGFKLLSNKRVSVATTHLQLWRTDFNPLLIDSKRVLVAFFAGVVLSRHDGGSLWAFIGSIVNFMLSLVLKRILNHERPTATLRSDPGMPSSHAQSISYIFVFAILSIVEWFGVNIITLICSGLVLALGSYLSWLRVSQKMHTISQVIVGACLGSVFSGLWYWWWRSSVLGAFDSILWVRVLVIVIVTGSFMWCSCQVVKG